MTDWTDQVADAIETTVGTVREKTVVPAEKIVRAIVGGLLAGTLLSMAAVLVALALFRGLVVLFTSVLPGGVWTAHLVLGGIFTVAGLFCWSHMHPRTR